MELLLKKKEKKEEIQTTEVTDICSDIYFSTLIKKKKTTQTLIHQRVSTAEAFTNIYYSTHLIYTLFL